MLAKDKTQTGLSVEIKVIPKWAWVLAGVVVVAAQLFFDASSDLSRPPHPLPAWARPLLGLLAGILGACYLLLIGYINRDAKRRGMSPTLWTILAIVIPNALGIILYFLLRQSPRNICPQCGHAVQTGFSFCPHCSYKLSPNCPQCQRAVGMDDIYCPYCGIPLRNQTAPVSG